MDVEVNGSKVTDLGAINLQNIYYGTLELASSPDGLEFAIRPAADSAGKPVRTGRTPATISGIDHGDYVVTFSRPGCRDHTSKVSVAKGAKSRAETKYVDGSLELTSEPSGASVSKDGSFLGTTPLVIHDLTPKVASFALTLPGYDSTPVSCEIPEGQTLKFSAHLLRKDRVFTASEVKTPPESYMAPAPVLSASQRKAGGEVVLVAGRPARRIGGRRGDCPLDRRRHRQALQADRREVAVPRRHRAGRPDRRREDRAAVQVPAVQPVTSRGDPAASGKEPAEPAPMA